MYIYDVFISYRRSDGSGIAESIAEYLQSKGLRVFFDKNEIKDSQDFKQRIEMSLRQAPNYILIATTNVFKFYTDQEDWVKREMEIACEDYDGNSGNNRVITVVVPQSAIVPKEHELPDKIQCLATPNRIMLNGELPADDEKLRILKAVTQINRHNLWNAGHRWLEDSKEVGGRFAALDINASLFPNASKAEQKSQRRRKFPIYVQREDDSSGNGNEKVALMQALSRDTNHVYLIGQGGIGKTATLVHIMNEAYGERQAYTDTCQIPLYVALSTAPDTYGALYEGGKSTFIRRAIYKQVREDRTLKQIRKKELGKLDEAFSVPFDTAVQPIEDLLSKITPAPEYLLLLDGLNEVSRTHIEEAGRSVIQMILQEINWLMEECPNVRVMITGRADEAMIHGDRLTRLALSGVEDDSIRQYLSACDCEEAKINRVFENDSLLETLRVPLFLVMYANLKDNDEISTQGEILRTFFNESKGTLCVYTVQDRLSQIEDDVENAASADQKMRITSEMQCFMLDFLLPEIAWYMEQRNLFALDEETIAEIIEPVLTGTADTDICGRYGKQIFNKYCIGGSAKTHTRKTAKDILSKLGSDLEEVSESFIDCCMFSLGILSANNGKFGIVHQHIRDYFASQKVVNQMWLAVCLYENEQDDTAYECLGTVLRDKPLSLTLRRFVGESLGEHKNKPQFIDGQWQYVVPEELCERSLIRYTLDVLRGVKCTAEYDLYNLIRIIAEIRVDLSGENLSALDFTKCSLNDIRLSRSGLVADITDATLTPERIFSQKHTDRFCGGCLSPDKSKIITYAHDGRIKIWDLASSECLRTIDAHESSVRALKYIRQKNVFVTASFDKTIKIWDADTFMCAKIIELPYSLLDISISNNGEMFCVSAYPIGDDEHIENQYIYNTINYELIGTIPVTDARVDTVIFSDDNLNIYIINAKFYKDISKTKYSVQYWNIKEQKCMSSFEYPLCDVGCYCYDTKKLITIEAGIMYVWNIKNNECIYSRNTSINKLHYVVESPDGKNIIFCHGDKTITIYDSNSFERIASVEAINGDERFTYVDFDSEGKFIIAVGFDYVYVWETTTYKFLAALASYQSVVDYVEFNRDGKKLLMISRDNMVKVLDKKSNMQYIMTGILYARNYRPEGGSFSADDKRIVLRSFDLRSAPYGRYNYLVSNWNIESLLEKSYYNFCDMKLGGMEYVLEHDELIVEHSNQLAIVDANDYSTKRIIAKEDDLRSVAYSTDGKYFIVAFKNYTAKIFSTDSWQCAGELVTDTKFGCIKYSSNGKCIAASCANYGKDPVIHIWDAATLECIKSLYGHSRGRTLANIDFKFDSCRLISASYDGTVKIWNLTSYECIGELKHNAGVTSAHYSSNGELIVTSSFDGTVKIWNANTYECLQTIPNIPGLFVQGLDLRNLAPGSNFTEEDKRILRMYGVLID